MEKLKVLLVNGSPHKEGNTYIALKEVQRALREYDIDTTLLQVGDKAIRGCMSCGACSKSGKCVYSDIVNEAASIFESSQGIVVASPVYYASANATLVAFMDRLFHSTRFDKSYKVGASVVVARRGGLSSTYDELNKYYGISSMPIATSQYWNSIHGCVEGEASGDAEGLQTLYKLGVNMAFLIKCIALGIKTYGKPKLESAIHTNFIR